MTSYIRVFCGGAVPAAPPSSRRLDDDNTNWVPCKPERGGCAIGPLYMIMISSMYARLSVLGLEPRRLISSMYAAQCIRNSSAIFGLVFLREIASNSTSVLIYAEFTVNQRKW